jgi:hypothetical protein
MADKLSSRDKIFFTICEIDGVDRVNIKLAKGEYSPEIAILAKEWLRRKAQGERFDLRLEERRRFLINIALSIVAILIAMAALLKDIVIQSIR